MVRDNNLNIYKVWFVILLTFCSISISEAAFNTGVYPGESFIDPTASINVTDFSIGSESYIAPFTSFSGNYTYIGSYSNVQDSGSNEGRITIDDDAVVAHGAELSGDIEIGSRAFVGFNSIIKDSKIGDGAYIGIASKVIGIDIPAGKSVLPGSIIDSPDDIEKLRPVDEAQIEFVKEVIEVNRALAIGYTKLFEKSGLGAFGKVGPHGDADIIIDGKDILAHSGSHEPTVGEGTTIGEARVIGHVILGENISIEDGTSIRGDEGIPLAIGDNSQIGKNNTFHSLNGKEIIIGRNFKIDSESVVHGPVTIGSDVTVGSHSVVFKSTIGNNVVIGDNAVVVGVEVPDGTFIPPGSMIQTRKDVRLLNPVAIAPGTGSAPITDMFFVAMIPILIGLTVSLALRKKEH